MVDSTIPWATANMQVCVWRSVKHDPSSSVAYVVWNAIACRVVRPSDHPVRPDRDRRAGSVKRICVAMLGSAAKHVYQAGRFVGRSRLLFHNAFSPLQTHRIGAHRNIPNLVLVPRKACPFICTRAERCRRAIVMQFRDSSVLGNLARTGQHSSCNLSCFVCFLLRARHGLSVRPGCNSAVAERAVTSHTKV